MPLKQRFNVNNGQTLTIANLQNGSFQGINFALGPTTTFEINQGGRIGNIGSTSAYGELNFLGSTVDVNDGGIFGLVHQSELWNRQEFEPECV